MADLKNAEIRTLSVEDLYARLKDARAELFNLRFQNAINQLEILARRGYFAIPTYEYKQEYDNNGNPIWTCECHIMEVDLVFDDESSSKIDAKKSAAFKMLKYVLGEEE